MKSVLVALPLILLVNARATHAQGSFEVTKLSDVPLRDSFAFSDTLAWVVGDSGMVFKWDGRSWLRQNTGTTEDLKSVFFLNPDFGLAAGGLDGQSGVIIRTKDGGTVWEEMATSPPAEDQFFAAAFWDDSLGGAFGANGQTYLTWDRGETWTARSIGTEEDLLAATFPRASGGRWTEGDSTLGLGWVVGTNGFIAFTADRAETWATQLSGTDQSLTSVAAWSPQNPIAVGSQGVIVRSFDRGQTWDESPSGTRNDLTDISDNVEFVYDSLSKPIGLAAMVTGAEGTLLLTDVSQMGQARKSSLVLAGSDYTSIAGWGGGFSAGGAGLSAGSKNGSRSMAERTTHFITAEDGSVLQLFRDIGSLVSSESEIPAPSSARLDGSYPNPFSGRTRVTFTLDRPGEVRIDIVDIVGRLVKTIVDRKLPAGSHAEWFDSTGLAPGVYVCRLFKDDVPVSTHLLVRTHS